MENEKVFAMSFSKVFSLLVAKGVRKGRTKEEVLEVTKWLTGYSVRQLTEFENTDLTYGDFFRNAPSFHPDCSKIKGKICGVQIETIEDPIMYRIRCLDKLVDDLAKGKSLDKVLFRVSK